MKKNILFLFPDQHRADWLPYTNDEFTKLGIDPIPLKMNNIHNLMNTSCVFTNAYTASPLCAPARACLASGKKYEDCKVPNNAFDYCVDIPTFYSALKNVGYSVGGVGKFDVHKKTNYWGLDGWIDDLGKMGFTHAIDNAGKIDAGISAKEAPQDPYMLALDKRGYREYHAENITTRKHSIEPTLLPDDLYCDNWLTQNALNMLDEFPDDKPWFLQVNFTGPHDPWDVTKTMRKRWENVDFEKPHRFDEFNDKTNGNWHGIRQNYAAMLENIDARIGDIIEKVKEKGQLENTIIVYASDHGELLGDTGFYAKNKPERGSVNIPMIIYTPGMNGTRRVDCPISLTDLTNTFLDFAGTKMDSTNDSFSLVPVLNGAENNGREYLKSGLDNWSIVVTDNAKLVRRDGVYTELYDTKNDVWHDNNLIDDEKYQDVLTKLKEFDK